MAIGRTPHGIELAAVLLTGLAAIQPMGCESAVEAGGGSGAEAADGGAGATAHGGAGQGGAVHAGASGAGSQGGTSSQGGAPQGGSGTGAASGMCGQLATNQCVDCCTNAHATPAMAMVTNAKLCVCSPVGCSGACQELCASGSPTLADFVPACQQCVAEKLTKQQACFGIVSQTCNQQPFCADYETCLAGCFG